MGEPSDASLMMFPPPDGDESTLWREYAGRADPSTREQMVILTMQEVALAGPASFNSAAVCDTLGVSYPMVNYYFGNRDGLIAEAAHATYVRYVAKIWQSVAAAEREPTARFRTFLSAHRRLHIEIRGWGAVLNYPIFSEGIATLLIERFGEDHRRHFELHAARLGRLILDLWDGTVSDDRYTIDDYPRAELLAEPDLLEAVTAVSWATLGVAVWSAGHRTPSRGIPEIEQQKECLVGAYVENVPRFSLSSRPAVAPPGGPSQTGAGAEDRFRGADVDPALMMFPPHLDGDEATLWQDFSPDSVPSTREQMVILTMREVALVGPASFNTATVCDALGVSYPMVNYYFGNRDGLIAEAGHATYVRYVDKLWQSVAVAEREPTARFRTFVRAHRRLNIEIGGWGAVLNYPIFSSSVATLLEDRFGQDHRRHVELYAARLGRLILDLWDDTVSDDRYTIDEHPREVLGQQTLLEAVTAVSWAMLGGAVWSAGHHTPSRGIPEIEQQTEHLVEAFVEDVLRFALFSRPTEKPPAA